MREYLGVHRKRLMGLSRLDLIRVTWLQDLVATWVVLGRRISQPAVVTGRLFKGAEVTTPLVFWGCNPNCLAGKHVHFFWYLDQIHMFTNM